MPLPLLVKTRIVVPRPAWPDGSVPETVPAGWFESCWPPSSTTNPAASSACFAASNDRPATCGMSTSTCLNALGSGSGNASPPYLLSASPMIIGQMR